MSEKIKIPKTDKQIGKGASIKTSWMENAFIGKWTQEHHDRFMGVKTPKI